MNSSIVEAINQYGFPIIAAMGLGYFVFYVWKWVTTEIKPVLGEASSTLVALIDRIRMLDNDMIRLTQKINMVLEFKEQYEKLTGKSLTLDVSQIEEIIDKDYKDVSAEQNETTKTWLDNQAIWHDKDMVVSGCVGFVIGVLFGIVISLSL